MTLAKVRELYALDQKTLPKYLKLFIQKLVGANWTSFELIYVPLSHLWLLGAPGHYETQGNSVRKLGLHTREYHMEGFEEVAPDAHEQFKNKIQILLATVADPETEAVHKYLRPPEGYSKQAPPAALWRRYLLSWHFW